MNTRDTKDKLTKERGIPKGTLAIQNRTYGIVTKCLSN